MTRMGDLISRSHLIESLEKDGMPIPAWLRGMIESEPSAEPEYKELQDWKTDFKGFIDALDMPRDDYCGIMEYIDEVPSAEPEIIRCRDCKWWGRKDVFKDGSSIIVCKKGWSGDSDGFCHNAERKEE